ncbi:mRNA decay activator protein ZFP36 isoform X2 [Genypterus blacodes]|uniref:mRNA decay activator protein ZFP36 isoform X2 n=1 Tax=Genypterus blacodes TaxID=154954 RepID=UPI003F758D44
MPASLRTLSRGSRSIIMASVPRSEAAKPEHHTGERLNLDLSESSRPLSSPNHEPSDPACWPSNPRGQQSESPHSSQPPDPFRWGQSGLLARRSLSMVETSSTSATWLGWPDTEIKRAQSDSSSSLPSSTTSSPSRYKTELCRSFAESGLCKYGGKCQFAHGPEELRDSNRHPKYKTEQCRTFHTVGFCPYGIRCHFVHNCEEERRSASSSSLRPKPPSLRSSRPPLVKQSFSFAGFPSDPQQFLHSASPPPPATFTVFLTELMSHVFLEMDSAAETCTGKTVTGQMPTTDLHAHFLPSPDSGCSACGPSPTTSPSLRRSPVASGLSAGPLGAGSLSDPDKDGSGGSSASSLNGSDSGGGGNEGNGRRLAVFSQLSVPEDGAVGAAESSDQNALERYTPKPTLGGAASTESMVFSVTSNGPDQKLYRSIDQRL